MPLKFMSVIVTALAVLAPAANACQWSVSPVFGLNLPEREGTLYSHHEDLQDLPMIESVEVHANRGASEGTSCEREAFLSIELELSSHPAFNASNLGFYFIVVEGIDENGIFPNRPVAARLPGPVWNEESQSLVPSTVQNTGIFGFHWRDSAQSPPGDIDLSMMVVPVSADGSLGRPAYFAVSLGWPEIP